MRYLTSLYLLLLVAFTCFFCVAAEAHVRGSIFKSATPAINFTNPNGDGFISSTGAPFSHLLDKTKFESPYLPIVQCHAESEHDAQSDRALRYGLYQLVDDSASHAESAFDHTRDPDGITNNSDEQLLFRCRLAGWQNGTPAFGNLLDIDNNFGFSGPTRHPNASNTTFAINGTWWPRSMPSSS